MFGYVNANWKELNEDEQARYSTVYCGICRQLRLRASGCARFVLSYDMAFLALLLMSLYEPDEDAGKKACGFHPVKPRPWVDNAYIRYCADMNLALAYYKAVDDYTDDGSRKARLLAKKLRPFLSGIQSRFSRQCHAIETTLSQLSSLEKAGCANPDTVSACFGNLMAELFVFEEDLWAPTLRQMGMSLGRYIYLADAAIDYRQDKKKQHYNPFLCMGMQEDWDKWELYLLQEMGCCTQFFEQLPLVQDKKILDNILYSGIWVTYRQMQRKGPEEEKHD